MGLDDEAIAKPIGVVSRKGEQTPCNIVSSCTSCRPG
jgi:hypothetical protein